MKSKIINLVLGVLVTLIIFALLSGCSSKTSPNIQTDIQFSADPIANNILKSLDDNDYAGFSKDFNQTMKNTLNQTAFDKFYSQMKTAVGDYQSDVFVSAATQNGAVTIQYIVQYSNEPAGAMMVLVLQINNGTYEVQGLNFDSPNLRGQPIDVNKVRAYADSETENILVSLNNNGFVDFSKDLDQAMKNAMPQTGFDKLYKQIQSAVGNYQSKEFGTVSMLNNIVTIKYHAKYTLEPGGVWVTISFDSDQKVAGLYFNSPKLQ